MNLSVEYLKLRLKNPLIVSSSGLTNDADKIAEIERKGAAAVVLKSLFEEQILFEIDHALAKSKNPEADRLIENYVRKNSVSDYLNLIETSKKQVEIPIIASINCISNRDWTGFAQKIENSGADALELNINIIPTSKTTESTDLENQYLEIVSSVKSQIKIPIAVKIGSHFTNILNFVDNLEKLEVEGIVMFNRFYEPDIDIDLMELKSPTVLSLPTELLHTLRRVGILSSMCRKIEISASTGIHDAEGMIKCLLAGAQTVQICTVLYQKGFDEIEKILSGLKDWMTKMNFERIEDFLGKLSYREVPNPAAYERSQFMKYFSDID
jgi:dihydroorotate dehydrogenase (fumarate)